WTAAGPASPKQSDYPAYVENGGPNPRGPHAIRVLEGKKDFTASSLIAAAFDSYLTGFTDLIPALIKSYDEASAENPLKPKLGDQIQALRGWDLRWSANSVPTSLAVFWGDELWRRVSPEAAKAGVSVYDYLAKRTTSQQQLEALLAATDTLQADY